jgi:hypothetical protein
MIRIVPAWNGERNYQIDIDTDNALVDSVDVFLVAYRRLYAVGTTAVGQSFMTIPADIPYGPVMFHAVGRDAGGAVVETGVGHYAIHEGGINESPFWVQLVRNEMKKTPYTEQVSGYRMRVEVVDAYGLPKKLFLFKLNRDWKYDVGDEFQGVCRPGDFDDYPEEMPAPGGVFYRKSYIDLSTPLSAELDELWHHINGDVRQLIRTMAANSVLETAEVRTIRV